MKAIYFVIFFAMLSKVTVMAQDTSNEYNPWIVGFHFNLINDSGEALSEPFNFKENYHFVNPFKVSIEKRFLNHFGGEFAMSTNQLQGGKNFNGGSLVEELNLFSADLGLKIYVTNLFFTPNRTIFEGFTNVGYGKTFFGKENSNMFNVGGGLNIFISSRIRIALQATGKFSFSRSLIASNFLQYDMGLIARL